MRRHVVVALILAASFGIVLVVALLPYHSEWTNRVADVLVSTESPDPIVPGGGTKTGVMTTATPDGLTLPEDQGAHPPADSTDFNIWNVSTWVQLQEFADRALSHAHSYSHVPEDSGFGYFDAEIAGGFDIPTRFRLNSVHAYTQLLEEQSLCRFQMEARPMQGDDAVAYGIVKINLTAKDLPCYSPEDLVGQHLASRNLEDYSIQVSSSFGLDEVGNGTWGTVWVYSNEVGNHFDLIITSYEDGYLLGVFEGFVELSLYQREDVRNQHQRGHLVAVFRAKI